MKKIVLQKIILQQSELRAWFVWEMLQKRILLLFCSMERNSEFSLLRNGSEQNSKGLLLFLFHGTEFRVVFSSAEWFRMKFRELLLFVFHCTKFQTFFSSAEFREFSVPRNNWNFAETNQLFRLFCLPQKFLCRKLPTLRLTPALHHALWNQQ
jgi:hypothetical protein